MFFQCCDDFADAAIHHVDHRRIHTTFLVGNMFVAADVFCGCLLRCVRRVVSEIKEEWFVLIGFDKADCITA